MDAMSERMPRDGTPANLHPVERLASAALGLALVGRGARRPGAAGVLSLVAGGLLLARGLAGRCSVYRALGVDTSRGFVGAVARAEPIELRRAVTVRRKPSEVYAVWRRLEDLPTVMSHVKHVQVLDAVRSRWTIEGPTGSDVAFVSEIVEDVPNERIAWRAEGTEVEHEGEVTFRPLSGERTEIVVRLAYRPPGGRLGQVVAMLLRGSPGQRIEDDLQRFKARMEAGPEPALDVVPPGSEPAP